MNIKTSELRAGNIVKTEFGICRVHAIVWNDIVVIGKDGRKNWAKKVEGFDIQNLTCFGKAIEQINELFKKIRFVGNCDMQYKYVHQAQNFYYWITKTELEINL